MPYMANTTRFHQKSVHMCLQRFAADASSVLRFKRNSGGNAVDDSEFMQKTALKVKKDNVVNKYIYVCTVV